MHANIYLFTLIKWKDKYFFFNLFCFVRFWNLIMCENFVHWISKSYYVWILFVQQILKSDEMSNFFHLTLELGYVLIFFSSDFKILIKYQFSFIYQILNFGYMISSYWIFRGVLLDWGCSLHLSVSTLHFSSATFFILLK